MIRIIYRPTAFCNPDWGKKNTGAFTGTFVTTHFRCGGSVVHLNFAE